MPMTWTQWPSLITWLTLVLLALLAFDVSRARARYGVRVPATTGNEHFERVYRAHMNTLENAVMFLPALWLAAWYWKPGWAAVCGAVWLLGRIGYAVGYKRNPKTRGRGFTLSSAAFVVLLVGSAVGWVRMLG
jgi:glutathione S-transferase